MKRENIDQEGIILLVDTFYQNIRMSKSSPMLRKIFEQHIGTELHQWKEHLSTMYSFWSSVMLRSGTYNGNPMQTHLNLGYFAPELFDEWLSIFRTTCKELFVEEVAETFIKRAEMIATTLKAKLYLGNNNTEITNTESTLKGLKIISDEGKEN